MEFAGLGADFDDFCADFTGLGADFCTDFGRETSIFLRVSIFLDFFNS